jgi:hypothetical protein
MTDDGELSAGGKVVASVLGFVLFYGLAFMLAVVGLNMRVVGPFISLIVAVAFVVGVIRMARDGTPRQRRALRWGALGFAAAMVVFGGCLGLLVTGKIRIAG